MSRDFNSFARMIKQYMYMQSLKWFKEECRGNIQDHMYDQIMWNRVFNRLHETLEYYTDLVVFSPKDDVYDIHCERGTEFYRTTLNYDVYLKRIFNPYNCRIRIHDTQSVNDQYLHWRDMNQKKNNIVYMVILHLRLTGAWRDPDNPVVSDEEMEYHEKEMGYCFDATEYYYIARCFYPKLLSPMDMEEPSWDNYEVEDFDVTRYGWTSGIVLKSYFDKIKIKYYQDITFWRIGQLIA